MSSEVEKKFEQFLTDTSLSSKGRVYVIDLAQVRKKLAQNWDRLKDKIYSTAASVIERRTDQSDIFDRWAEDSYIIAFGNLDEARSKIKVNLIAQEISTRLLGKNDTTHKVTVASPETDANGRVIWDHKNDISKLMASSSEKAKSKRKLSNDSLSPLFSGDIDFVFRPLWFLKNQIISSYCCIPIKTVSKGHFASSYSVIEDSHNLNAIKALDLICMKKIYREAQRLDEENISALLTFPMHFESLASSQRKLDFVKHCQRYLKRFQKRIVTELVYLPEGIPQSRLQELVQAVKPFSRAVMARFKLSHTNFEAYKNIGVFAVGADVYDDKRTETQIIQDIERFAMLAEKHNLSTYIHGIRTTSLATAAICSGIDYIDGYAVSEISKEPMDAHFMSLKDNYLAKYSHLKDKG